MNKHEIQAFIDAWQLAHPEPEDNRSIIAIAVSQRPDWKSRNQAALEAASRPIRDNTADMTHKSLRAFARYYDVNVSTARYWITTSRKDQFEFVDK